MSAKQAYNCFTKFEWNQVCDRAFNILKVELVSAHIRGFSDSSLPFILETGASFQYFGALLSQMVDKKIKVIYSIRRLRSSKRNDANKLDLSKCEQFDIDIMYRPGRENRNTPALS